ncbi:allantoate permease family MFS transporter [Aspergillus stella-maris]|uniref:allantoate permease family MFS transporter n=1 Tax=Aspergillus stella-maris TaxID=1810926 RepID=UPI003CCD456B
MSSTEKYPPKMDHPPSPSPKTETVNINTNEATSPIDGILTPTTERRVLRKLDLRLAPMFAVLYFVAYLDRSNISNAAVAGLKDQLNLSGSQYSTAVSVFYATYVPFMLPAVLAVRRLKPHRAITAMVVGWSIVTVCTAFVRTYKTLVVVRVLLGFCEAGFFPCLGLYIAGVYKREEQGLRIAYLFSSASLASMFGGLIATGITNIDERNGLWSWSWLYIIEGSISILVGIWVWFGLPVDPSTAPFWTEEEKTVMAIRAEQRASYMGDSNLDWKEVQRAFMDPKVYMTALIQFFQDIIMYGFTTFLPSILQLDLGYTSLEAQYMSVPVYFLGGIVFFSAACLGDKWGLRGTLLLILDIFPVIGYSLLLSVQKSGVRYFACYLIAIPLYCGPGLNEIWLNNNMAPHYRRATALGIQQLTGNLAGIVAPQVYTSAPYVLGHWCSLGATLLSMGLIASQIGYLYWMNKRKEEIGKGIRVDDRREVTGEGDLGFRYVY